MIRANLVLDNAESTMPVLYKIFDIEKFEEYQYSLQSEFPSAADQNRVLVNERRFCGFLITTLMREIERLMGQRDEFRGRINQI